jgi:hypothetical protein
LSSSALSRDELAQFVVEADLELSRRLKAKLDAGAKIEEFKV